MHFMSLFLKYNRRVKLIFVFFVFLSYFPLSFNVHAAENTGRDALFHLLPLESQLKGWKLDGAPQTAGGQELYLLINGGAEIYMQEGFRRAILASYSDGKGKVINLEIFEMTSPESAKRIHMKKIGKQGKKLPIGDDAVLEDYYLNFQKERFQVTLSGYDSEEETVKMLLNLAQIVAKRIDSVH